MNSTRLTLEEWATLWRSAREDSHHDCAKVLNIWKINPAKYCGDTNYLRKIVLGYRKNSPNYAGEKKYEKALLDGEFPHLINVQNGKFLRLHINHHAVALANKKSGQTITDCMGVLYQSNGKRHPIAIEIKENANNPWYAVVEVLQQIRLMRAGVKGLKQYFKSRVKIDDVKGAWGMVLAPDDYYAKDTGNAEGSYAAACELCEYMIKNKTEARVIMASIDLGIIKYKAGYWPGR